MDLGNKRRAEGSRLKFKFAVEGLSVVTLWV